MLEGTCLFTVQLNNLEMTKNDNSLTTNEIGRFNGDLTYRSEYAYPVCYRGDGLHYFAYRKSYNKNKLI